MGEEISGIRELAGIASIKILKEKVIREGDKKENIAIISDFNRPHIDLVNKQSGHKKETKFLDQINDCQHNPLNNVPLFSMVLTSGKVYQSADCL